MAADPVTEAMVEAGARKYCALWFSVPLDTAPKAVQTASRHASRAILTAALAAARPWETPEPVYKAVERILDDNSAWIARPSPEVTKRVAFEAVVAAKSLLEAEQTALAAAPGAGWPDYVYDAHNWECTFHWEDRDELASRDYLPIGEMVKLDTLIEGPPVYAAHVIVTTDDAGDADDTEIRWFRTEDEARAALPAPPPETEA